MSATHVTVLETVAVLLHASIAVKVLVCDRSHPFETTAPSDELMFTVPQPSVAVAVPNAVVIADEVGLQPKGTSE